jgi:hypothetical protein
MTIFLAWVYAQSPKVYSWLGNSFNTLYNGALNAWNWAFNQASNAYNNAVNYAYNAAQNVRAVLMGYVDWLSDRIIDLRNNVIEDLLSLSGWVEWKLGQLPYLINSAINVVWSWIDNAVDAVRNDLNWLIDNSINYVLAWVSNNFSWVFAFKDFVNNILSMLTTDNINALLNMLNQWRTTGLLFFNNPLGFILDIIQAQVLGFLSYVIAWALGTTKYELPNTPPWKN